MSGIAFRTTAAVKMPHLISFYFPIPHDSSEKGEAREGGKGILKLLLVIVMSGDRGELLLDHYHVSIHPASTVPVSPLPLASPNTQLDIGLQFWGTADRIKSEYVWFSTKVRKTENIFFIHP